MINVFGSCVGEEELLQIKSSIDNQWLGMGEKVETLEKMLAAKIGVSEFTLIDTASNGLYLALEVLNLPKRSDIVLPAITWISCANAIKIAGYNPVFADVDYDSINMTLNSVANVLTKNTNAVMLLHYGGLPCNFDIDLPTIGDCAHAVDSYINGIHTGLKSNISVFSFDSMKNIACGELGGICSRDKKYSDQFKNFRYCGILKSGLAACTDKKRWWEYKINMPFIKMLPNDISASIGIAQFKKLNSLQKIRKNIWKTYNEQLKDINWIITPPPIPSHVKHSYFTYFIKVINGGRDKLARYLLENGIYTTVRYQPLHLYSEFGSRQKLPVAQKLNEQLLNLPLHPSLSANDVDYIIDKIKKFKG